MPERDNLTSTDGVVVILKTVFHFLPTLRCTQVFDPTGAVTMTVNLRFFATLTLRDSLIVGTTTTGAVSTIGAGSDVGWLVGSVVGEGVITKPGLISAVLARVSVGVGAGVGALHELSLHPSAA